MIKNIIRIVVIILILFILSVIIVNIIRPVPKKKIGADYREYISQIKYQSDNPGTERVMCIENNDEALLWRLRMIGAARETIVLTTFDLRMDNSGLDVVAALFDAAERGVSIKLLIDGIYQPVYLRDNEAFYALCAHKKVEARIYNPISIRNIYNVNYRMHDKYIMIDEKMYLLGGRNTTDTFLGELHKGSNIDREILVYNAENGKGNSFRQLEDYFARIWNETRVQKIDGDFKEAVLEEEYNAFRKRYQSLLNKYEDIVQYDGWYNNTFEANQIMLLSNGTSAENKEPGVLYAISGLASEADEVIIQTPYVICNKYMYSVLQNIKKDAELKIFINAVEKGTNPWGCTDYLNNKNKILKTGADVYELMNEYAVHTKTVLVDNNISIIGSYNLDMRSTYLDTELMLVVDSEQLNSCIRDMIEQYKVKSIEVLSDGTEKRGSLYQQKEMTDEKKFFYGFLRIIIRPFRHLL